jgi:hypothetical protein
MVGESDTGALATSIAVKGLEVRTLYRGDSDDITLRNVPITITINEVNTFSFINNIW